MNLHGFTLVFDVDDTLYLERNYVRCGFEAAGAHAERLGISRFYETAWQVFERGARGNVFDLSLIHI